MKKFLLLAGLLACVSVANAQDTSNLGNLLPTSATFSVPEAGEEDDMGAIPVPSVNETVTISFNETIPEEANVLLMTSAGSGFAVDMQVSELSLNESRDEATITLDKNSWGNPYISNYYLALTVTFVDDENEYILRDEEPVYFSVLYTTPDTFPAELVREYPTGQWSNYYTFSSAYDQGIGSLYFTEEVIISGSEIGSVHYELFDGLTEDFEISEFEADWDYMEGLYVVNFLYSSEDYEASEISSITIEFSGINNENGAIKIAPIILQNDDISTPQKKATPQNKLSLGVSNDNVNVYNLQGMVVKENIPVSELNSLPTGLYIVNGKKFVVR